MDWFFCKGISKFTINAETYAEPSQASTQHVFTCSKVTVETLEQYVKYVQS